MTSNLIALGREVVKNNNNNNNNNNNVDEYDDSERQQCSMNKTYNLQTSRADRMQPASRLSCELVSRALPQLSERLLGLVRKQLARLLCLSL